MPNTGFGLIRGNNNKIEGGISAGDRTYKISGQLHSPVPPFNVHATVTYNDPADLNDGFEISSSHIGPTDVEFQLEGQSGAKVTITGPLQYWPNGSFTVGGHLVGSLEE